MLSLVYNYLTCGSSSTESAMLHFDSSRDQKLKLALTRAFVFSVATVEEGETRGNHLVAIYAAECQ